MDDILQSKTVEDFGEQWQTYQENKGYYASLTLFQDILGPLVDASAIQGCRVADIGSGTGRIVQMLANAGALHITAVEPSSCFPVLLQNVASLKERVACLNVTGDKLPSNLNLDFVFSFGVIHHIPEPLPTLKACYQALRPGGSLVLWLYGWEGNALYLNLSTPLRAITTRLPNRVLSALSWALWPVLASYIFLCRFLPLPMHKYMVDHLGKLSIKVQMLTIFDQLNPAYAKYYRKKEVVELFKAAGFSEPALYHRHGYSWTAVARKK